MVKFRPFFLCIVSCIWIFGCSKATFRQARVDVKSSTTSSTGAENPVEGESGPTTSETAERFPSNHSDGRPDPKTDTRGGEGEDGDSEDEDSEDDHSEDEDSEDGDSEDGDSEDGDRTSSTEPSTSVTTGPVIVPVDGTQILDVEVERHCKSNEMDMLRQSKVNRSSSIQLRLYRDRMDQEPLCHSSIDYKATLLSDAGTLSLNIPDCGKLETGKYELAFHDSSGFTERNNKWALRQSSLGYIQLNLEEDGRFTLRSNGASGERLVVQFAANVYYERYGAMYDWLIQEDYDQTPNCDSFWGPEPVDHL